MQAIVEQKIIRKILKMARQFPTLRKIGGLQPHTILGLSFVGEREMTRINRVYRKKNRPTDVLSFPAPEPFRSNGYLGDLVICLPVLKRQARNEGHSVEVELKVLLVHGFLHLLGMDHEGTSARARLEARKMGRWETRLLGKLGVNRAKESSLIGRHDSGRK
jgi:rRNA maturation RNase YbeY